MHNSLFIIATFVNISEFFGQESPKANERGRRRHTPPHKEKKKTGRKHPFFLFFDNIITLTNSGAPTPKIPPSVPKKYNWVHFVLGAGTTIEAFRVESIVEGGGGANPRTVDGREASRERIRNLPNRFIVIV